MKTSRAAKIHFFSGTAGLGFTLYVYGSGDMDWTILFFILSVTLLLSPYINQPEG